MGSSRDLAQLHRLGIHTSTARNTPRLHAPVLHMASRRTDGRCMDVSELQRRRELSDLTRAELIERVVELEQDLGKLNQAFEAGQFT